MRDETIRKPKIKVFISYATKDTTNFKIPEIVEYLESQDATIEKVFYWERDAMGGQNFDDYMIKKIADSNFILFFCSQESLKSESVHNEIGMAKMADKEMMPVFREKQHIPKSLERFRGVKFYGKDFLPILEEIFTLMTGKVPQKTEIDLHYTFIEVMEVSSRVKKTEVAELLKVSEEELFTLLIEWKNLGFKIDGDMIVMNDVKMLKNDVKAQLPLKTDNREEKEKAVKKSIVTLKDIKVGTTLPDLHGNEVEITAAIMKKMKAFEKKYNKNAIWRGKVTGTYLYYQYFLENSPKKK